MITFSLFTFTPPQWGAIKVVVLRHRGVDADQIERQVAPVIRNADGEVLISITGVQPLRERIEIAVGQYRLHSAVNDRKPSHAELIKLRKDAMKLRTRIDNAVSVPLDVGYGVVVPLPLHSVDGDMRKATSEYFGMWLRYIDRLIAQAASRRDYASKTARNQCREELLTIWCDIGGEADGVAATEFLMVASEPVMGAQKSGAVLQWLERRRRKIAKAAPVAKVRAAG